jgi:SAM-dependent methyltransferase
MNDSRRNRFQDFFEEAKYVILKNYLYNYLVRKRAIERAMRREKPDLVLEVGSGISPILTGAERVVYLDLSPLALDTLKGGHGQEWCVAGDGMRLPFKSDTFTHAICSEVLEHVLDDLQTLRELARVMRPRSCLIVTVPHRKFYFANDDRFVNHYRRYELVEIHERLREAGFTPKLTRKVLGPLEKLTMSVTVLCFSMIQKLGLGKVGRGKSVGLVNILAFFFKWVNILYAIFARLDAAVMPRALSTVLLIRAERD